MLEEAIRRKVEQLLGRVPYLTSKAGLNDYNYIGNCEGFITEVLSIFELAIPLENHAYRRRSRTCGKGFIGGCFQNRSHRGMLANFLA